MTIDGQNNLHMCNTHTVEETNFAKFFDLRGSARETLEEEEREREREREFECKTYKIICFERKKKMEFKCSTF